MQTFPNSKRQIELDAVKAIAIVFMVFGHTMEIIHPDWSDSGNTLGVIYSNTIILLADFFSAPAFMFCLGVGLIYSRHQEARDYFHRGVLLLLIGYCLSITTGMFPQLSCWLFGTEQPNCHNILSNMFCVDILQFSGVSFLFLGLVKLLRLPFSILVAFTLGLLILGVRLTGRLGVGTPWPDNFVGLLFWVNDYTTFPFSLWFPYILLGMVFGHYLIRAEDKKRFYRQTAGVGAVGLFFYAIYAIDSSRVEPFFFDYFAFFRQTPLTIWITTSALLLWIPLVRLFCDRLSPKGGVATTIQRWSRNITVIFCVQWFLIIFICRLAVLIDSRLKTLDWYYLVLIAAIIVVASDYISSRIVRRKKSQ